MRLSTLLLASSAALWGQQGIAPDYSGNWTLDTAQSTGLPDYYSRVKSHTLTITQSSEKLDVHVTVDAGMGAPDKIDFSYLLNGVETSSQSFVRGPGGMMPVPTKLKASLAPSGEVAITIARHITMGTQEIDAVTNEKWQLSSDGKKLVVHRLDDSPMGKIDATMVFVRS